VSATALMQKKNFQMRRNRMTKRGFPITKNEAIDAPGNQKEQQFMASDGTGKIGPRPVPTSVEWIKKVRMTGEEEDLPEP